MKLFRIKLFPGWGFYEALVFADHAEQAERLAKKAAGYKDINNVRVSCHEVEIPTTPTVVWEYDESPDTPR